MKKILYFALALLGIAFTYYFVSRGGEPNRDEHVLATIPVTRRDLAQSVTATGIIKPKVGAQVNVGAQVSGSVENLFVEIGSEVKKGMVLAEIDGRAYRANADRAIAVKEEAAADERFANIEFNRAKALFAEKAIPLQQLDAASRQLELAVAKRKQAEADSASASIQLGYTEVTSPIDGVVASITTQKGETVNAGLTSPTFVTVIDLRKLELWGYVDETEIGKIRKGQKVEFRVDTFPGESFEGTVKTVFPDAVIQNNVVNYIVVVTIRDRPGFTMRPQMDANVSIYIEYKKGVLAVPKKCVRFDSEGRKSISLLVAGKPETRPITTGISDEQYYEILSGLSAGDAMLSNEEGSGR